MRLLLMIVAAGLFTGCASITRGTSEDVVINSLPEDAEIRTSTGHTCPRSPCTVNVSRKTSFIAYAEKEGYKPGQVAIGTKVQGGGVAGVAGNVLLGGVVGIVVDASTGAAMDHVPNPALIVLEPVDPANPSTPTIQPPPVALPPRQPSNQTPVS